MYKAPKDWERTARVVAGDMVTLLREAGHPDAYASVHSWDGMKVAFVYEGYVRSKGYGFSGERWEDLASNLMTACDVWRAAWSAGRQYAASV